MSDEFTVQRLFDLSGKTAIVTGGTGHLGESICHALAEAGASVIVTSRDERRAEATAKTLSRSGTARHGGVQLDQLSADSIESCFGYAVKEWGNIDILINNAHHHTTADLTNCTFEDFNHQLSNATGYFLLARRLRDHVVERRAGASIVMIGSMYGLVGSYPDIYEGVCAASPVAYHALKGGVLQLTRHLAVYWAPDGVRVNALSPGPFPGISAADELRTRLNDRSPMHRTGSPHEIKGAVVFLASDASSYVTGHNLVVDGGWTAW